MLHVISFSVILIRNQEQYCYSLRSVGRGASSNEQGEKSGLGFRPRVRRGLCCWELLEDEHHKHAFICVEDSLLCF